ncbi:MAG: TonB-dependent receptor [Deltaproteobacteria bacterium]|nr:TonB-dependent receptor [Deltaproteobacteria bacterium]
MLIKSFILFLFIFSNTFQTQAKSDTSKPEKKKSGLKILTDKNDEEIVVTARRIPETPFESNRNISLLKKSDISKLSPRSTPEALLDLPGIFLQKTNHGGGAPIIRGMIGPRILLMYDGVRLNNSVYRTGPLQYLNALDQTSLHKIEVLSGAGSVLYGSDAMGGVIHSIPIGFEKLKNKTGISFHSSLSSRFQSADNGRIVNGSLVSGNSTNGFLGAFSLRYFDNLRAGGTIGEQIYTSYHQGNSLVSGFTKLNYGIFRDISVRANYLYSAMLDAGRTDKLVTKNQVSWYDNTMHLAWSTIHVPLPSIASDLELVLSWQKFFERKDDHSLNLDNIEILKISRNETRVSTLGMDLKYNLKLMENSLRIRSGILFYMDMVNADKYSVDYETTGVWESFPSGVYPDNSTYSHGGSFLLTEYDVYKTSTHKIEVNAGARFSFVRGHANAAATLPEINFSNEGLTFFSALSYIWNKKINISSVFSQGMRAPNLQEAVFIGDAGKSFEIPGENLTPEYSDNFEIILKGRFNYFTFELTAWHSRIHDIIGRKASTYENMTEVDGKPVMSSYNGELGILYGAQGVMHINPRGILQFRTHMSWTWGEQTDDNSVTTPMTRIPPFFLHAGIIFKIPVFSGISGFMEGYFRYAAKQSRLSPEDENDVRIPEGGTPSWYTFNLRTYFTVNNPGSFMEKLNFGINFENILDEEYKYHGSGVYSPGRNFILFAEAAI